MGFGKTGAGQKPTLVCVGTASSLGSLTASKTEGSPYYYENIEIRPQGDGVKAKLRLMWAPAWFNAAFASQKTFAAAMDSWSKANGKIDADGNMQPASGFVFEKNISAKTTSQQSFLEGLCGSAEPWEEIQTALTSGDEQKTAAEVHEILADFFAQLGPQPFLYSLRQERRDGVATEYYEVDEIRWLTEANVKYFVKKAARVAERIAKGDEKAGAPVVFKFVPSDFGIDVELPESATPDWVSA